MAGRKIRDEADAVKCLDAAAESGLPQAEWARQCGIDGRSLNVWRTNLARRESGSAKPPRMVELVPARPRAARYVIRWGEIAIEVDDDFNNETLERLLQVVAPC